MMSDFNKPAYPSLIDSMLCHDGAYTHSAHRGLTIRQQAVLMAPASEIADIVPSTAKDCAMFLGITVSEYAQDYLANYLRAVGKARCMWADAVLRAERESRDE